MLDLLELSVPSKAVVIALIAGVIGSNVYWSRKQSSDRLHYASGIEKINKKNFDGAVNEFAKALEQNPDDPSAHFGIAWAYQMSGRNQESITHYQRSIALSEDILGFSYNNLQFLRQNMKDTSGANLLGHKRSLLERMHAIKIQ